jgi:DNA-binding transcriptional regulator YhcF (GntR family)
MANNKADKQDGAAPVDSQKLDELIAEKVKAGLTREQALQVIEAQAENDKQK